ncbi:MAG: protein kinase domain-containing protein [Planctomycetota bacterium]|jgi:serine/threonine protein kinase
MSDKDTPEADVVDERETVDVVADEFAERFRNGELPSVTEYVSRYPEQADELRELLPAVVMMEQLKKKDESQLESLERQAAVASVTQLGDFRVVREIGKGGMGVVYEAEQESLGRHVALKVLSPSALGSETAIARFRREAETVAQLHHTNIVPIFGVGEEAGLHYYVMQLIDGQPLSDVISGLRERSESLPSGKPITQSKGEGSIHADAGSTARGGATEVVHRERGAAGASEKVDSDSAPYDETHIYSGKDVDAEELGLGSELEAGETNRITRDATARMSSDESTTDRLASRLRTQDYWHSVAEIGVQVARALDYAHRHGVWHRDIKPSNLLVDDDGIVWMVDFGLARLAEASELTQTGDLLGTLRYMAPEQLSGQFDQRSDLYSLGLTLFELLAFRPAHEAVMRTQLLNQVTEARDRSPRAINSEVPNDLDTIVLKATSHDPEHRYQSAGELADDLQRYLDGFPIKARRVGPVEQLFRWRRRNPALAATSFASALLVAAVAVSSTWGFLATRSAYSQLEEEQRKVIAESQKVREEQKNVIVERERAEENLNSALAAFEELLGALSARSSAVSVDFELGDEDISAVTLTTIPQEDADLLLKLLDFYKRFAEKNTGSPKAATYAAKAQHAIGDIRQRLGQYDEAVAAYDEAINQYEQSAKQETDEVEFTTTLARLLNSLGVAESRRGDFIQAIQAHTLAYDALSGLPEEARAEAENRFLIAQTLNLRASIGQRSGLGELARPDMGPSGFDRDKSRGRGEGPGGRRPGMKYPGGADRRTDHGPPGWDDRDIRDRMRGLKDGLFERILSARRGPGGSPSDILRTIRKSITESRSLLNELVAEEPDNSRYQLELARSYLNAVSLSRVLPPFENQDSSSLLGDLTTAVEILEELVAANPDDDVYRIELADALAVSSPRLERDEPIEDEQQRLSRSVEIARQLHVESPDVSRYADRLGRSLRSQAAAQSRSGHDDMAVGTLQESVDVLEQVVNQRPDQFAYRASLARTLIDTSKLQRRMKTKDVANSSLERAIDVVRGALPELDSDTPPPPAVRGMYGLLMGLLRSADCHDEADEIRHRLERFSRGGPPDFGRDGYHQGRPDDKYRSGRGGRGRFGPSGGGPRRPGPPPERPPAPPEDPPPPRDQQPDNRDRSESSTAE